MHSIAAEALSLAMYGQGRLDYCSFMHDSLKGEVNLQLVNRPGRMCERTRQTIGLVLICGSRLTDSTCIG